MKGLAAAVGLGGFLPLLGPAGERLGLDPYGRLLVMPGKTPLTGEMGQGVVRCGVVRVRACVSQWSE